MAVAHPGAADAQHWNEVYRTRGATQVSWFQSEPTMSLELVAALGLDPADAVIDVGAGASQLVDRLLERGHHDLTVLDISADALHTAQERLGARSDDVHWVCTDLLSWRPQRRYQLWHDRAVFHFLINAADQGRYRTLAADAVAPGGYLIIGTFAADGPTHCSGLPVARYSPEALATALDPDFVPVTSRRDDHHTPGGAVQPFSWQVLRRLDSP